MPTKILSLPFFLAMFPLPDGAVSAADRAQLAVGYPLAALAPAPPAPTPVPEAPAVVARVPSIQRYPMVYRDILQGWMEPWRYSGLESRKGQKLIAVMSQFRSETIDKSRMLEETRFVIPLCHSITSDIFKAKELLKGEAILTTEMPDKLTFGMERRLLIDQLDRWLGV